MALGLMNFWVATVDIELLTKVDGRQSWMKYHFLINKVVHYLIYLSRQLQLELDRIPTRNLGRDDRVISSHGKETRHPFLSLSVVSFLAQLPVHIKMDPRLEQGVGDKMLLRLAARKVGLVEASTRKKRAMQFGSHSARMIPGEGDKKGDLLLREKIANK